MFEKFTLIAKLIEFLISLLEERVVKIKQPECSGFLDLEWTSMFDGSHGGQAASFYSPCKSGIYGDSARGIHIDSSSLSFSDNYFKVLIEIFELQEWLTTQWKAYFE